ncbi:M57 family metalloprotease [Pendulispora brunnea]|uniref:M57 family metalloprotease n=1 Tax=Pendulispora brunnea TaxID=2905690 RepID=A0ABZ2K0G7_9BACT
MRTKKLPATALVCLFGTSLMLCGAVGCAADSDRSESDDKGTNGTGAPLSFEDWSKTVHVDEEGVWIVNGDTPVETVEELRMFYDDYVLNDNSALIVHHPGTTDAKWNNTQKLNITYCVSKSSFGSRYNAVVSAMSSATGAWEAAANVNFVHKSGEDGNCTKSNGNVVFDVRQTTDQSFLARAFFPNQGRSSRNVLISTSAFGSIDPYTLAGILRHELGHTLGFRHEHTRPESGTCFEDNKWRALTSYDPKSVMHYPQCNGTQTGDLKLTTKDKQGAAALYGAP